MARPFGTGIRAKTKTVSDVEWNLTILHTCLLNNIKVERPVGNAVLDHDAAVLLHRAWEEESAGSVLALQRLKRRIVAVSGFRAYYSVAVSCRSPSSIPSRHFAGATHPG